MVKSFLRTHTSAMSIELKRSIGRRVQAARTSAKLTQEQLAERIERSPEAVSNIERGVSLPTIDTLDRIARALSVKLAFFFDEIGAASPHRDELDARAQLVLRALSDRDAEMALAVLEAIHGSRRSR